MAVRNVDKCIAEFRQFYELLMITAPPNYRPWFFPCQPFGKDPSPDAILAINGNSRGSWHSESARLTKEQCIDHIQRGYNIGLSARDGDPLVIIDIDDEKYLSQAPKDTLTVTSRKRCGLHAFCWAADSSVKINIPTSHGEVRSNDQYVLACGSFVPFNLAKPDDTSNEKAMKAWMKEKNAFNELDEAVRCDENMGYYTIRSRLPPRPITYDELPILFREKDIDNKAANEWVELRTQFNVSGNNRYYDLHQLKMKDIVGEFSGRKKHPLHDSDTDANFSLGENGILAHCWRHLVSLNVVQYLCVEAGYAKCEDAGTPHRKGGVSKLKGDRKALDVAYDMAVKKGLITAKPESMPDDRPRVRLPEGLASDDTRTIGTFAKDVGAILSGRYEVFFNVSMKTAVEIRWIHDKQDSQIKYLGFVPITGERLVTLVEKDMIAFAVHRHSYTSKRTGEKVTTSEEVEKNMTLNHANLVIVSDQFINELPRIKRIFTVPIPILYEGKLTFPTKGYDPRFESWLDPTAPELQDVSYDDAIATINYIFSEFCFKDKEQDKTHAIAALITPFLRGLYGAFNERTPLFFYLGNRERAGKDYCAGITGIVYEGNAKEDTPLSEGDDQRHTNIAQADELRKKIVSAMISGRKRMHFSNCKGRINNSVLESVITSKVFQDRLLGKNDMYEADNEMDFSLSGNVGISYTADLQQRSRFINFMLSMEEPNKRRFNNPNLHGWVTANRGKVLGTMYALVKKWHEGDMPKGETPFASFPSWADICGGILIANGLGDPCKTQGGFATSGNTQDRDMKRLFELGYSLYKNDAFTKIQIVEELGRAGGWIDTEEIFTDLVDLCSDKPDRRTGDRVKFAKLFVRYIDRDFSNIRLVQNSSDDFTERYKRYHFEKIGEEEAVQ